MKNLTKITLFVWACLIAIHSYSQTCQASFTYTIGSLPGQLIITDNSTTPSFSVGYVSCYNPNQFVYHYPDFSSGTINTSGGSTSVQALNNGMFIINYSIYGAGCNSVYIDTVIINTLPTNLPCDAGLTITPGTNAGEYTITDNSIGEDFGYFMFNYNYNNSILLTQNNPSSSIQTTNNGQYPWIYYISDTLTGCFDSILGTLNVTNNPCIAQVNVINQGIPGQIAFFNSSSNSSVNTLITPGATVSSQTLGPNQYFLVYYNFNGTYPYTFIISNPSTGCSDTITGTVTVTNSNPPCTVQAGLNIVPGANPGDFILTDNSTNGVSSYFISGMGTPSIPLLPNASTTITYSANGIYTYTYVVQDSNTMCSDTLSGIITVTGVPVYCQASLTINQTGPYLSTYSIVDNSINATSGVFTSPNINSSVNLSPLGSGYVYFNTTGVVTYTYTITNSITGCTDSINGSLTVQTPVPCQANVIVTPTSNAGEFVFQDASTNIYHCYLYPNLNTSTAIYLQPNSSTTVQYPANGVYNYSFAAYNVYTNCYYSIFGTITVTGINTTPPCSADFILLQDSLNPSQYYCWNTSTGGSATSGLAYFWSFGDGNSSTLQYPVHTYNSLGYFQLCLTVVDSIGNCTSTFCDTIYVSVKASGTTLNVIPAGTNLSIEEQKLINSASLYPNPTNGNFTIDIESAKSSELEIAVVNLAGQTLYKDSRAINSGNNKLAISDAELAAGTYLVSISNVKSGETKVLRLVKN